MTGDHDVAVSERWNRKRKKESEKYAAFHPMVPLGGLVREKRHRRASYSEECFLLPFDPIGM